MAGYRQTYFKHNKQSKPGFYTCVYCWQKISYRDITVDHIIPQKLFRNFRDTFVIYMGVVFAIMLFLLLATTGIIPLAIPPIYLTALVKIIGPFSALYGLAVLFFYLFMHSHYNLVASCQPCNSAKGAKLDHRILKAWAYLILKSRLFWLACVLTACYFYFVR